jgi:hypothetical protein
MRRYLAHGIVVQNRFTSKNLSGRCRTFPGARAEIMGESLENELWLRK